MARQGGPRHRGVLGHRQGSRTLSPRAPPRRRRRRQEVKPAAGSVHIHYAFLVMFLRWLSLIKKLHSEFTPTFFLVLTFSPVISRHPRLIYIVSCAVCIA